MRDECWRAELELCPERVGRGQSAVSMGQDTVGYHHLRGRHRVSIVMALARQVSALSVVDASTLLNKSYLVNPPRLVVRVELESTIEVADNPTNIKALHPSITIIQDMPPGLGSHPYDAHCKCGSSFVGRTVPKW